MRATSNRFRGPGRARDNLTDSFTSASIMVKMISIISYLYIISFIISYLYNIYIYIYIISIMHTIEVTEMLGHFSRTAHMSITKAHTSLSGQSFLGDL